MNIFFSISFNIAMGALKKRLIEIVLLSAHSRAREKQEFLVFNGILSPWTESHS